jgi:hypothetical protein
MVDNYGSDIPPERCQRVREAAYEYQNRFSGTIPGAGGDDWLDGGGPGHDGLFGDDWAEIRAVTSGDGTDARRGGLGTDTAAHCELAIGVP